MAPRELRLIFNEDVELAFARLSLTGPQGGVALAPLALAQDSPKILLGEIRGALVPGPYTVAWQVASEDGHPVRGTYSFTLAPGAAGLALLPAPGQAPPPAEHHDPISIPSGPGFDAESPLYVGVRWLTFLGLLGVVGAVAFRLVVLPLMSRQGVPESRAILPEASGRAAGLGLWMAALVGVAALLRLYAQSYALHGSERALDPVLIGTMLSRTLWGWGWILQLAGTVLSLAGFALARRSAAPTSGWAVAALGALVLAFTPGLSGHAASAPGLTTRTILADGVHVLGAGGWLGSLLFVVVVGIPVALRLGEARGAAVAALVRAFSPTALVFAGAVFATGVFAAWIHLGSVPALWTTAYGRTLLLKLAVLSVVFGTGAYNFRFVLPRLGDDIGTKRLRRSASLELAAGVIVLVVTAILVATATPAPTTGMEVIAQGH
ncbi:MAG: CopD family protein [Gemmatimonadota bacterium]|nr:CopD family protein [Gemmatimonadota bacterium]